MAVDLQKAMNVNSGGMGNSMNMMNQMMQLKNQRQASEINKVKMEQEQLQLEQMKKKINDLNMADDVVKKHGMDYKKAMPELFEALGDVALPIIQQMQQFQASVETMDFSQVERSMKVLGFVDDAIDDVESRPEENRPAAYNQALKVLSGILPPEALKGLPSKYDPDLLRGYGDYNKRLGTVLSNRMKEQQLKTEEFDTQFAKKRAEKGPTEAKKTFEQSMYEEWLVDNPKGTRMQFRKDLGDMSKAAMNPEVDEALNAAAESLASGDPNQLVNPKDIVTFRGNNRIILFSRAKALAEAKGEKLSYADINRKIKMMDDMYVGKGSQNLLSYNTFLRHAAGFMDAADEVNLFDSPAFNKPMNWWRENAEGNPELRAMLIAIEPVWKEFQSFLLNNRALYNEERQAGAVLMSGNSAPDQFFAAIKQMGETALVRAEEANWRYKKVIGSDIQDLYSPESLDAVQRIGFDISNRTIVGAPKGATSTTAPKVGDQFGGGRVTKVTEIP